MWYNPGGANLRGQETGSFTRPFLNLNQIFDYFSNHIDSYNNFFILIRPNHIISETIDFTNTTNNYHNLFSSDKRLYIIGMSNTDYNNEQEILNDITSRYGPFNKTRFLSSIQQHKVDLNYRQTRNNFDRNSSEINSRQAMKIKDNVTIINFTIKDPVNVIITDNNKNTIFSKCLFLNQVKVYQDNSSDELTRDDNIFGASGYDLSISSRIIINLCMFYNINSYSTNTRRENECDHSEYITNRTAALEMRCSKADIYDNVFLKNEIGIIAISPLDTILNTQIINNITTINIKNCKIFNSTYDGLIASFPNTRNYITKIINVDCSYTKEGNGFKVRNCNLVKCKALWNKYYGFILLGNKYLYKCHALNNQTGIIIASTNNNLFRYPYFKFRNHTQTLREYEDSLNDGILNVINRKTNFYNCSIKGSLGGSGIVYTIYSSYSMFINCEISGNQGSLESFYDISSYKRDYYFTGGGIKGFKDNNLCFINCSIVGNLGYGICIIDDLKKILSSSNGTITNYLGENINVSTDEIYTSEFVVASCNSNNNVVTFQNSNDVYDEISRGNYNQRTYNQFTIDTDSARNWCQNFSSNIKEASSYIGHIILINTIVSSNRGGQIVKLFDFINSFPHRYLEINSLIDNYNSNKFFSFPKNVCTWNPYKGIYEVGNNQEVSEKIGLSEIVTTYNSIPPTEGFYVLYRGAGNDGGIFRAFKRPDNVDNARDDLDLRLNTFVDKDYSRYIVTDINGVEKKVLEGCQLFIGNELNGDIKNRINNKLNTNVNTTNINNNYDLKNLFFDNDISYLPDISHYRFISSSRERMGSFRDDNFIRVSNKFYENETDIMYLILNDMNIYYNTHKQFLELSLNHTNNFESTLKEILSYDFDDLERDVNGNSYIGCFEKHNYCNYQFNTTGRTFNKNTNSFTSTINCCSNQDNENCTSNRVSSGISNDYPSGLERSLVVDYTEQDIDFEQDELEIQCQRYQDNLNTRDITGVIPDLSDPDIAEDSCIIPNFEMFDFNGSFFESRFICGEDCKFSWNSWIKLIEGDDENTLTLSNEEQDVYFRTGNIIKLNEETKNSLRQFSVSGNALKDAEKLYPNICPNSGEFEFEESNEEFFCNRTSINENVQNWHCNKKNKNELPLIPDGCPSFGGKKCPISNIQFVSVEKNKDPSELIGEDSFSIKNSVDNIIVSTNSISVDDVLTNINNIDDIDPADPNYIRSKCYEQGFIQPQRGLSGLIQKVKKQLYTKPEEPDNRMLIIIVVIMVVLIALVSFM